MDPFSDRLLGYLARPSTELRPWSPEALADLDRERGPLARGHAELEAALFAASGDRGLPVLGTHVLGAVEALRGGALPLTRTDAQGKTGSLFARSAAGSGLYVFPDRHVEDERGWMVAREARAELERMVLLAGETWLPIRAEFPEGRGDEVAEKAKLPRVPEASDGWTDVRAGDGVLALADHRMHFASFEGITRVLRAAAALGANLYLESSAPSVVTDADDAVPSDPLEARAQCVVHRDAVRLLACDPAARRAEQATVRKGRILTHQRFGAERTDVVRYAAASRYLAGHVSARVLAFCDVHGIIRDPALVLGFDGLASELDQRGLPFHDAWFDFEERCGGLVWDDEDGRLCLSLGSAEFFQATAEEQADWRDDTDDRVEDIWPVLRWGDRMLLRAGARNGFDERLYVDDRGAVYRASMLLDTFTAEAENGRRFLEKEAATWEMRREIAEWAPTIVGADVASALVQRCALIPVEEASDAVSRVFRGDGMWVWQRLAFAPSTAAAVVVARSARRVVEAVTLAREAAPGARIEVAGHMPGGKARLAALAAAGIDAQHA